MDISTRDLPLRYRLGDHCFRESSRVGKKALVHSNEESVRDSKMYGHNCKTFYMSRGKTTTQLHKWNVYTFSMSEDRLQASLFLVIVTSCSLKMLAVIFDNNPMIVSQLWEMCKRRCLFLAWCPFVGIITMGKQQMRHEQCAHTWNLVEGGTSFPADLLALSDPDISQHPGRSLWTDSWARRLRDCSFSQGKFWGLRPWRKSSGPRYPTLASLSSP